MAPGWLKGSILSPNASLFSPPHLPYLKSELYPYQKALDILRANTSFDTETIGQRSAPLYHGLARVAEEQRQWTQAEHYYQQALQLFIEFDARYAQASTYHQLGRVAQEQRQWKQAEQYYQQALQIKIEFHARYEQAGTYHQLGTVAQEQRQWKQARDYLLQALEIFVAYNDAHYRDVALHSLARLGLGSGDAGLDITGAIADRLGITADEAEELLHEMLEEEEDEGDEGEDEGGETDGSE